jgi:hypothetical protein
MKPVVAMQFPAKPIVLICFAVAAALAAVSARAEDKCAALRAIAYAVQDDFTALRTQDIGNGVFVARTGLAGDPKCWIVAFAQVRGSGILSCRWPKSRFGAEVETARLKNELVACFPRAGLGTSTNPLTNASVVEVVDFFVAFRIQYEAPDLVLSATPSRGHRLRPAQ